jgi:hypothetical protein
MKFVALVFAFIAIAACSYQGNSELHDGFSRLKYVAPARVVDNLDKARELVQRGYQDTQSSVRRSYSNAAGVVRDIERDSTLERQGRGTVKSAFRNAADLLEQNFEHAENEVENNYQRSRAAVHEAERDTERSLEGQYDRADNSVLQHYEVARNNVKDNYKHNLNRLNRDYRAVTANTRTHIVERGEHLSGIACTYGVSLKRVISANPTITNIHKIRVGQSVNVPQIVGYRRRQRSVCYQRRKRRNKYTTRRNRAVPNKAPSVRRSYSAPAIPRVRSYRAPATPSY